MYEDRDPIASLVHLWVDGAFNRRELIRRVAGYTGSVAAAIAAVDSFGIAEAQTPSCPVDASVPADAPDIDARDVQYPGDAGALFGYLAQPRNSLNRQNPGILVIHENRGLVEHIRDCTRRIARAGFVGLGIDLLSRQGGSSQFTDPAQQVAAYSRTTAQENLADMFSSLTFLKLQASVDWQNLGAVGFCAGGANCFNLAVNADDLGAAAVFYGAAPPADQIANMKAALLGLYPQLDTGTTSSFAAIMPILLNATSRKTFSLHVYEGAAHAFHNDTGPAYNPEAACDAWTRTIAWFNKFLRPKQT